MAKHFESESTTRSPGPIMVQVGRIEAVASGQSITVGPGERKKIGRGPACDLVVDDRSVSAIHAEVHSVPEGLRLVDQNSTNGTFLNGVRLEAGWILEPTDFVLGGCRFRALPSTLEELVLGHETRFGHLVGTTPGMLAVFEHLRKLATSDISVLIIGETGTGKDLAAQAIHAASSRRDKPFIAINCSELHPELLDSELFGHKKGAFTTATASRRGLLETANGGTLFLDEVAEMSRPMQAKLLRVLEKGEVRAVGSEEFRKIDVRLLFATNVDLEEAVNKDEFRADLYFRIARAKIDIPPLRRRKEDIPFLISDMLKELGRTDATVGELDMAMLLSRTWPGNVRELRNVIEHAIATSAPGAALDFREAIGHARAERKPPHQKVTEEEAIADCLRRYYTGLYSLYRGNITRMAKHAGKHRYSVRRTLAKLGLKLALTEDEDG